MKTTIRTKQLVLMICAIAVLCFSVFSASANDYADYCIDPNRNVQLSLTAADAEYNPVSGVGYTLYFYGSDLADVPDIADVNLTDLEKTEMDLTDEMAKQA